MVKKAFIFNGFALILGEFIYGHSDPRSERFSK